MTFDQDVMNRSFMLHDILITIETLPRSTPLLLIYLPIQTSEYSVITARTGYGLKERSLVPSRGSNPWPSLLKLTVSTYFTLSMITCL